MKRSLDGPSHKWSAALENYLLPVSRKQMFCCRHAGRDTRKFGSKHASCLKGWAAATSRGCAEDEPCADDHPHSDFG